VKISKSDFCTLFWFYLWFNYTIWFLYIKLWIFFSTRMFVKK